MLYEKIKQLYPQLEDKDFMPLTGTILLQNDSDGNEALSASLWGLK